MTFSKPFSNILVGALMMTAVLLSSVCVSASVSPHRISMAYCKDCVPFSFSDEKGQPTGILIDIWNLWSKKADISIDFMEADWDDTLKMVGSGEAQVQVHAGLFFSDARDQFLDYGVAFADTDTHYFTHVLLPSINNLKGLSAYRVGVLSGDYVEAYLKERLPAGAVLPFPDYASMMTALQEGSLRVFAADTPTGLFHLKKSGLLSDFTFVSEKPLYQNDLFPAVQEGNHALVEVINNGMALITAEEKRDLHRRWFSTGNEDGKALILSMDRAYPPLTFINTFGNPSGLLVDMWRAWSRKTGRQIEFRASSWGETLEGLRVGEADIHSGVSFSRERDEWMDFSTQIYETFARIYHLAGEAQPEDISSYGPFDIGTMAGSYQEMAFRKTYPNVAVRTYTTHQALMDALLNNEIKAMVQEERLMAYSLDRLGMQGDILSRPERLFPSTIHAGIPKGNASLLQEINDGFSAIPRKELAAIEKRWVNDATAFFSEPYQQKRLPDTPAGEKNQIALNGKEAAWLAGHRRIRLGVDPDYPPLEFVDEQGRHRGITADYVALMGQRLGIECIVVPGLTRSQVIEKVKKGEIDLLSGVVRSSEYDNDLYFSNPYISFPIIIAVHEKLPYFNGLNELSGYRIGVLKGSYTEENLTKDYPDLKKVPFSTLSEGLRELNDGKIDAFVDTLTTIIHEINQAGLHHIKISAPTEYKLRLSFGVRKQWPELVDILNKFIMEVTDQERLLINNTWMAPVQVKYGINIKKMMMWAVPVGIFFLLVFLFGLIWNRRLIKEVAERKRVQQEYQDSERKIFAMSRAMDNALVMIDSGGKISFWNPAAEKLFGYTAEEALGLDLHEIAAPSGPREKAWAGLAQFAKNGQGPVLGTTTEVTALDRAGNTFPVEVTLSSFQVDGQWFAVGTVHDISERKKGEAALIESEARIRRILDSINTGILIIDPALRVIVDANSIAAAMIGLPKDQIVGRKCHEFICPGKENQCPILDLNQRIDNAERVLLTATGKEIKVLKTVVSVRLGGKPHLIESFVDLTERKKVEAQLTQHVEDLERFNHLTITREERMIELKSEINHLLVKMGKTEKYKIR